MTYPPNDLSALESPARGERSAERGISILVADDDPVARTLVEALIAADDGLELVASAGDAAEAVELAARHRPDVAVLDWVMPAGGGPAAALGIAGASPRTMITALTSCDTPEASFDMNKAGAMGFLVKGGSAAEFGRTIRQLVEIREMRPKA